MQPTNNEHCHQFQQQINSEFETFLFEQCSVCIRLWYAQAFKIFKSIFSICFSMAWTIDVIESDQRMEKRKKEWKIEMKNVVFVCDVRVVHCLNRHYFYLKMFSNEFGTPYFRQYNSIQTTYEEPQESWRCVRANAVCGKFFRNPNEWENPFRFDFILLRAYFRGEIRCSKNVFLRFFFWFFSFWKMLTEFLVRCSLLKFSLFLFIESFFA